MGFSNVSENGLSNPLIDLTKNSSLNGSLALGALFQIILVAFIIRGAFRDNHFSLMGWIKAFSYSLVFVVATPLISQIASGLLVWGLPYVTPYLDVLTLLGRISSVDQDAASSTRPWAYALALLATIGFLVWRIRSIRRRSFKWVHASQTILVLILANIIFQLLIYGILNSKVFGS
jgi:hypothetical protein